MRQRRIATMILFSVAVTLAGQDTMTFGEGETPHLLPETELTVQVLDAVAQLAPTMGVEGVFRYSRQGFDFGTVEAHRLLYNILRSVSKMTGLHYYSASRKKMRLLFESSYVIDDPKSRTPIPDPIVEQVPEYSAIYIFQKDLTTGSNLYQSVYQSASNAILLKNVNLNTLFYYFLPMVRPGNSLSVLLVTVDGSELVFYGLTAYRMPGLSKLARKRKDSLHNRMKALFGWFIEELELALQKQSL